MRYLPSFLIPPIVHIQHYISSIWVMKPVLTGLPPAMISSQSAFIISSRVYDHESKCILEDLTKKYILLGRHLGTCVVTMRLEEGC